MNTVALHRDPKARRPALAILLVLGLTLGGFLLRLHHLDYESLGFDEADAVRLAMAPWSILLPRLFQPGENGPLFYILLRLWSAVAGQSEYALRFLSLMPGVLFVPLLFVFGRRLISPAGGLAAALLAALFAFPIYYAQEAKMYMLVSFLSLLASHIFLRALQENRRIWWAGYVVSVTVGLYLHIFAVLLVAVHALYFLLGWHGNRQARRGWLVSLGLLTLPYLPLGLWHLNAIKAYFALRWGEFKLTTYLSTVLGEFGSLRFGPPMGPPPDDTLALLFGLLLVGGLALSRRRESTEAFVGRTLFLGVWLVLPSLALFTLSSLSYLYVLTPRYDILALPAFLLTLAAGLTALGSRYLMAGLGAGLLVLAPNIARLSETHFLGVTLKDDWRHAIAYVEERRGAQDGIFLLNPGAEPHYRYYARRPFHLYSLPSLQNTTVERLAQDVEPQVKGFENLWVMPAYAREGPEALFLDWLTGRFHKSDEQFFGPIVVARYRLEPYPSFQAPSLSQPLRANFDGKLELLGAEGLPPTLQPGVAQSLTLFWQARSKMERDYWVSLRLIDARGQEWARVDGPPNRGFYPTPWWRPGQVMRDTRELTTIPGTPPGLYELRGHVFDKATMQEIPVLGESGQPRGTFVTVRSLSVLPTPGDVPPPPAFEQRQARFGQTATLVGYQVPHRSIRVGEFLAATISWRVGATDAQLQARWSLVDPRGHKWASWSDPLPRATNPQVGGEGQLLTQQARLLLPPDPPTGLYRLRLELEASGKVLAFREGWGWWEQRVVDLGEIRVFQRPRSYALPQPRLPRSDQLGPAIRLLGYDVTGSLRPGGSLEITLYWKALGRGGQRFTVFVHLLGTGERVVAQHDGPPAQGDAPTTSWLPGEIITDRHQIFLPPSLPQGRYQWEVGLYDPLTGQRVLTSEGADRVLLGTLDVR